MRPGLQEVSHAVLINRDHTLPMAELHPQIVHVTIILALVGVLCRLVSLTGRVAFAGPAASTLLIAAALAVSGYTLADETLMFNEVMPTALRWPIWPFHVSVCAGGVLLCIQLIRSIFDVWRPGAPFLVMGAANAGVLCLAIAVRLWAPPSSRTTTAV